MLLVNSPWMKNIYLDKLIKPEWTKIRSNSDTTPINNTIKKLNLNEKNLDNIKLQNSTRNIEADKVWEMGFTGKGQAIVVIDDGIDSDHDMFANKIIKEACFSETGSSTDISLCANGSISQIGQGSASNCRKIIDACDHGTHVAGIALGNDQNGAIRKGVAYEADLIPIQVFTNINDKEECDGKDRCIRAYLSSILGALNYVIDLSNEFNIAAVNMSLGGSDLFQEYCDDDFRKVSIDSLKSLNIATVISAGNDGSVGGLNAPSCISSAVSVSSVVITEPDNQVNHSPLVDLLAPGFNIRSASFGNNYVFASGTSMAAPHVSGAFALLKSAKPEATIFDIEEALKESGIKVTTSNWDWETPRLSLANALNLIDNGNIIRGTTVLSVYGLGNNKAQSFLRFYNPSNIKGSISGVIVDDTSGEPVSTFEIEILSKASKQISFEDIVNISIPEFIPSNSPNQLFTIHISSTFKGYVQHVLWNPTGNSLTNISGCKNGLSNDIKYMGNIHTSILADTGYPSYLFIHNSSLEPDKPNFEVYDARNGEEIGQFTIQENIPSKSTAIVFVSDLVEFFGENPSNDQLHINIVMSDGFNGFSQHMIDNTKGGLITNMSAKCGM